jgi:hypothetical protein
MNAKIGEQRLVIRWSVYQAFPRQRREAKRHCLIEMHSSRYRIMPLSKSAGKTGVYGSLTVKQSGEDKTFFMMIKKNG